MSMAAVLNEIEHNCSAIAKMRLFASQMCVYVKSLHFCVVDDPLALCLLRRLDWHIFLSVARFSDPISVIDRMFLPCCSAQTFSNKGGTRSYLYINSPRFVCEENH